MSNIPQYQRAVTPTLDGVTGSNEIIRGKMLSYQTKKNNPSTSNANNVNTNMASMNITGNNQRFNQIPKPLIHTNNPTNTTNSSNINHSDMMNITGASVLGNKGILNVSKSENLAYKLSLNDPTNPYTATMLLSTMLGRQDLVPLTEEIPTDGVIFARLRSNKESLFCVRTPEERLKNPERLNLDRR